MFTSTITIRLMDSYDCITLEFFSHSNFCNIRRDESANPAETICVTDIGFVEVLRKAGYLPAARPHEYIAGPMERHNKQIPGEPWTCAKCRLTRNDHA